MWNGRKIGICSVVGMLAVCMAASVFYGKMHEKTIKNTYREALTQAPKEEDPLAAIGEDFTVDITKFSSHLPLVILDTNGTEPPIHTYLDATEERFLAIEGVEPYVVGKISVIAQEDGENTVLDKPQVSSYMRIKRRGNSSMLYEKAQWLLKLETAYGEENDLDMLGMGKEHEWILNGSMFDKSMLRNYLAYSTAASFMPYVPDSRYCEVLLKEGEQYTYQGVYLLMENIKQGEDRVDIEKYHPKDDFNSYLVRRDRYEEGVNILDTYAVANGYCAEYFELLYPSKRRVTPEMLAYVEDDISAIEKILYAEKEDVFRTYAEVIDVDSFVDYFLLNEFFASYDAGNFSTYFYKDVGGKLKMGPVWDFDGTMDNYKQEALDTDALAMQTKPWFAQLCKDERFIKKLEARYVELRRGPFSEQAIANKIDEIVAHLGGAQEREWSRWGHWYTTENEYSLLPEKDADGKILIRNAVTFEDEIYRLKTVLREHSRQMPEALRGLEKMTETTTGIDSWMGWLLLLAAGIFLIPSAYAALRK